MSYEQNDLNERKQESVYSKRIKAGKRRTYFFDVRATRGNDYFLTSKTEMLQKCFWIYLYPRMNPSNSSD